MDLRIDYRYWSIRSNRRIGCCFANINDASPKRLHRLLHERMLAHRRLRRQRSAWPQTRVASGR